MPAFGRTSGILLPLFSFRSATDFRIGGGLLRVDECREAAGLDVAPPPPHSAERLQSIRHPQCLWAQPFVHRSLASPLLLRKRRNRVPVGVRSRATDRSPAERARSV